MSDLTITKIDSLEKLGIYREQYQSLLNSVGRNDALYFDLEYMSAMNSYFLADDKSGINREFYFLLAFRGEQLIGVAPFLREKKRLSRFGLRRIYHFGETNDSLMVSFPQYLAHPHEKPECIAATIRYLNDHSRDWDIVDLGYLFLDDEIELYKKQMPGCVVERDPMICHAADVRLGFDSFMQAFSPKHRRNFRRSREKLESSHRDVHFLKTEQLTEPQQQEIEALHVRRQQTLRQAGVDRDSLFEVPAKKKAFRDCDEILSRKRLSRHYLLYADGRLIAFQLCYRNRDAVYLQLIAMDDDYRKYSPAKLLVLFAYQEEARDGVQEINLLLGTNPLKKQFGKLETVHYRVTCLSPRISSTLRIGLWRTTQRIKNWIEEKRKNNQKDSTSVSNQISGSTIDKTDATRNPPSVATPQSEHSETINETTPICLAETDSTFPTHSGMTSNSP